MIHVLWQCRPGSVYNFCISNVNALEAYALVGTELPKPWKCILFPGPKTFGSVYNFRNWRLDDFHVCTLCRTDKIQPCEFQVMFHFRVAIFCLSVKVIMCSRGETCCLNWRALLLSLCDICLNWKSFVVIALRHFFKLYVIVCCRGETCRLNCKSEFFSLCDTF